MLVTMSSPGLPTVTYAAVMVPEDDRWKVLATFPVRPQSDAKPAGPGAPGSALPPSRPSWSVCGPHPRRQRPSITILTRGLRPVAHPPWISEGTRCPGRRCWPGISCPKADRSVTNRTSPAPGIRLCWFTAGPAGHPSPIRRIAAGRFPTGSTCPAGRRSPRRRRDHSSASCRGYRGRRYSPSTTTHTRPAGSMTCTWARPWEGSSTACTAPRAEGHRRRPLRGRLDHSLGRDPSRCHGDEPRFRRSGAAARSARRKPDLWRPCSPRAVPIWVRPPTTRLRCCASCWRVAGGCRRTRSRPARCVTCYPRPRAPSSPTRVSRCAPDRRNSLR